MLHTTSNSSMLYLCRICMIYLDLNIFYAVYTHPYKLAKHPIPNTWMLICSWFTFCCYNCPHFSGKVFPNILKCGYEDSFQFKKTWFASQFMPKMLSGVEVSTILCPHDTHFVHRGIARTYLKRFGPLSSSEGKLHC